MDNKLVSIIIPVYNSGKKLNRCIESLLCQTYTNIEIIIVDDKSPDKLTLEIEKKWQFRDARVRLFLNEQNGRPEPRFRGISEAKGTYICFSDQDDWMPKDAIAKMVHAMEEYKVDIVIGQITKVVKVGPFMKEFRQKSNWNLIGKIIEKQELMDYYYYSYFGWNILPVNVWAKMYTRDLFQRAFKDMAYAYRIETGADDLMLSISIHPYVNRLCVIDANVYSYFVGLPGVSPKYLKTWLPLSNNLFAYKWEMLDKYNFHQADKFLAIEMINYLKSFIRICTIFARSDKERHISVMKEVIDNLLWQKVGILLDTDYKDQEIVKLVLEGDAESVFLLEESRLLMAPPLTKLKNWLHKSLVHFKS